MVSLATPTLTAEQSTFANLSFIDMISPTSIVGGSTFVTFVDDPNVVLNFDELVVEVAVVVLLELVVVEMPV
jgi:hypothetical protein